MLREACTMLARPPTASAFVPPSSHGLRGNYAAAAPDWTVPQAWDSYTPAEHDRWRRLYARQAEVTAAHASPAFLHALAGLDTSAGIPRLDEVSAALQAATGWRLAAVPGLLPDSVFFAHLAERRFPVTRWLREEREFDYIVEPDIFHDFCGHVPMLFQPAFANGMQAYGARGLELDEAGAKRLARLYWYVVEFGLERTPAGLKAFGAGILSSAAETVFAVTSPSPNRIAFDLGRVLRTRYRIDDFQETYFVLDRFEDLLRAVERPLCPVIDGLAGLPDLAPHALEPGDRVITRGQGPRPQVAHA
jgi:phenylalanine-4-hydroxylase